MTAVPTPMATSKDEITRWSGWPLRQRPLPGILILVVLLGSAIVLWDESPWLAPLVVLVPVLVNGRYFFPSNFEATSEGLKATHPTCAPRSIRWDAVDRVVSSRSGVWMVVPQKSHRYARVRIIPVYDDIQAPCVNSVLAMHWEASA
ncbi:MAG: hypothetical protein CMJ28_04535 [Phycisphaerae bacterium]|nr:hypothetical protein [Phycisphaerae bacterium]